MQPISTREPAVRPPFRSLRTALAALRFALVLLAAGSPALRAAEPWEAPAFSADPAAVARAAADVPAGKAGTVILYSLARFEYDADGRETYTHHVLYKIGSASAHESWSAIQEPWAPWHQQTPVLRARVITPDGAEHLLDPATITDNAQAATSPEMFEDGRLLRAPLPAIRPGVVVEQEVTIRDTAPFFEGGVAHYRTLQGSAPVRHSLLVLDAPEELPLHWSSHSLGNLAPREEKTGGRRRLTFEARDLAAVEEIEPGLPPEVARLGLVAFSTGRSWSDIARRYSDIVDRSLSGADLRPFLRAADGPAASQMETVGRVLAHLHKEVRYTGVELGAGGLIPRTPAETLRRKFGDCKDKSVLLAGLLRALDIPAYVALLYAAEGAQDLDESVPGFGGFNHAIVVIPGTPAIWIDPTDPYSRAGELPPGDQGRLALIASPTTTGLVRTPEAAPGDDREIVTREVFLADLGPARIVETSVFYGAPESSVRASYASVSPESLREGLKSFFQKAVHAEDLNQADYTDLEDLSTPFRIHLQADKASRGITDIHEAAVGVFPHELLGRLPDELVPDEGEELKPRQAEYVLTRLPWVEMGYRIVPPAGFAPRELPPSRERRLGPAVLSESYTAGADNVVNVAVRLELGKRRLSAAEFEALRAAVGEIASDPGILIYFDQVGETHLAAGRVPEAIVELERLASAAPRKALPLTRVSRALLAGGLGEAARKEAERAVKLEPTLALAHRNLGWVLQHDALGRRFGPGYDRAAALASYRKACELDPKDAIARADLAILLEHDARGERYAPGSDLGAAIEEYRSLRKDLDNKRMDDNLVVALLRAGRLEELRGFLAEIEPSEERRIYKLVAIAGLEGAEAAARLADREIAAGEARLLALRSAAQNLILLRRYPEAALLLERASRQSANAAELLSTVELLRRTRRHEDLSTPLTEPVGPVYRFLLLFAEDQPDVSAVSAFFSRQALRGLKDGKPSEAAMARMADLVGRPTRDPETPMSVLFDVGLASFRETLVGDPATGYRVKLTSSSGERPQEILAFVVVENGEHRLLAMGGGFEILGDEALSRLESGDLKGARQWLDWASETVIATDSDPLWVSPLATLWTRGGEAPADEIRCAATALAVGSRATEELARTLTACREAAGDDNRRRAYDLALAYTWMGLDRDAELLEVTERLAASVPTSPRGFHLRNMALVNLKRTDDLRHRIEERLRLLPDDPAGLRALADLENSVRSYDLQEAALKRLMEAGKAAPGDFNQLAWMALVRGQADDQVIELAQKAASLRGYRDYASLHTLATVYAEVGRTGEAYQILLQAVAAREGQMPNENDWYVFGRLAELYGLPEIARTYYEKVKIPGDDGLSTQVLADRRLKTLSPKGKTRQAVR